MLEREQERRIESSTSLPESQPPHSSRLGEAEPQSEMRRVRQSEAAPVPHVILLSEAPALQGVYPLACHLAQLAASAGKPVLLVDLAPAASRLAHALASSNHRFSHWREAIQPLWVESTHGRTLHLWQRKGKVDIVAQLGAEFPTASQLPRLVEQLVRQLGQTRVDAEGNSIHYSYVFLLSEYAGVPLDLAGWRAADEVWLLHDPQQGMDSIAAHLVERLASVAAGDEQKLCLVNKLAPKLADWARRQRLEVDSNRHPLLVRHWPHYRSFNLTWPLMSGRLAPSLARAARELWYTLSSGGSGSGSNSGSRSDRQAS